MSSMSCASPSPLNLSSGQQITSQPVTFSTGQVVRVSGATLREVQWWTERGIVPAQIRRGSREFLFQDAVMVCVIQHLRRRSVPLKAVRIMLPRIRGCAARGIEWAVCDPKEARVYEAMDSSQALERCVRTLGPVVVVPLAQLKQKVESLKAA